MRTTRFGAAAAVIALTAIGVTTGLGFTGAAVDRTAARSTPVAATPVLVEHGTGTVSPVAAHPTRTAPPTTRTGRPRTTTTRTTTRTSPATSAGLPCSITGDGACVSLSRKRAWLVRGGRVVLGAPITTGRPGERTPPGTFHVTWKDADHRSAEFDDAPMPWSVFFNGGIAFHTGSLSRQSAGCVHLSDTAARQFFRTLSVGDTVVVVR